MAKEGRPGGVCAKGGQLVGQAPVAEPQNSQATAATTTSHRNVCAPANKRSRRSTRVLFLFGGPTGRNDGLEFFCEQLGAEAEIVDWCDHEFHNLISGAFYYDLLGSRAGRVRCRPHRYTLRNDLYGQAIASGRNSRPPTPEGPSKPDLYGLPGLRPFKKEQCRKGALLAYVVGDSVEVQNTEEEMDP